MVLIKMQKRLIQELNEIPLPTENQYIIKNLKSVGNNLLKVVTPTGEECFASIPTKFRKFMYAGPRSFLVCERIPEGNKVKFEVCNVLYSEQVKYFIENDVWPEQFLHEASVKEIYAKVQNLRNEPHTPSLPVDDDATEDDMCGFQKFDPNKQLYGAGSCQLLSEASDDSDDETSEYDTDSEEDYDTASEDDCLDQALEATS